MHNIVSCCIEVFGYYFLLAEPITFICALEEVYCFSVQFNNSDMDTCLFLLFMFAYIPSVIWLVVYIFI